MGGATQEELRRLNAQVVNLEAELASRPTVRQLADLEAELTRSQPACMMHVQVPVTVS